MAYGNIVGYEPAGDTPGAYRFKAADGTSLLSAGPAAEDLKAKLDASAAAGPQPVAGPGGGVPLNNDGSVKNPLSQAWDYINKPLAGLAPQQAGGTNLGMASDLAGGGYKPPSPPPAPPTSGAAPPSPPPAAAPAAPGPIGPPPPPAPAAPSPGAPPSAAGGYTPVVVNGIATGDLQGADGRIYRPHAATAGSPGGLVQRTEVRSGGHTVSEEFMAQQEEAYQKRQAAAEVGMQAAQEQAAATRSFQEEQLRQGAIDQAENARRQAQIQTGVESYQKKYDDAQREYTTAGKDVGDHRGVAERLVDGLAAGLGAFGSAMNGTPNFAMQMIQQKINNNIHSQEVGLATRKDKAQGLLADLVRQTGSLELAKTAAKGIQLKQAQIKFEQIASSTADARVRANALDMSGQLEQQHSATMEAYRQQAEGEVTKSFVNTPKVASSRGGVTPLTPAQALEYAGKKASVESTVAGTAGTIDKLGKGGKKSEGEQKALATIATADTALKSLSAYKDDDVPSTLENQNLASSTYHRGKDLLLGAGSSARGMSERDRALIQDTEAARGYVKSLTSVLSGQGALSGPESAAADKGLAPGATVGDLKRAVAVVKARAEAITAAGGSVEPEAAKE